jgi:cold shock protein
MPQRTVKKLVAGKGFGFIDCGSGDMFFHCSEVKDADFESLSIGQMVSYEVGQGPKGPRATSVTPVA